MGWMRSENLQALERMGISGLTAGRLSVQLDHVSNFEARLRAGARLTFSEGIVEKTETDYREGLERSMKFWEGKPFFVRSIAQAVERDKAELRWDLLWRQAFSGVVPESWSDWKKAEQDFLRAGRTQASLSDVFMYAGLTYPDWRVVCAAAMVQKLNTHQLAILLVQYHAKRLNVGGFTDAMAFQREKGIGEQDVREAERLAGEILRKMTG